jgi:peptide/nickel transport system ATP-binding protein
VDTHRVVLEMRDVSKTFRQQRHEVPALVGVDLGLEEGETLGLVGESGSGKSTLAKTMLGIHAPDAGGEVAIEGSGVAGLTGDRSTDERRAVQMIFQNPDSALNRNWTVRRILKRSVTKLTGLKGAAADKRVDELAESLRLTQRHLDLKPRQLSGGLKQRVAIARAFAGDPRIVVCDEPTSALDVSVQAAILNVLADLQAGDRTSYLFISHDLGVVRYLSDRIAVMYLGRIMELGTTQQIFDGPNHPYTEALLSAVPSVDGDEVQRIPLTGEIPSPANPPAGCVFHTRCHRFVSGLCDVVEPATIELSPGHVSRCHLDAEELSRPYVAPDPVH